MNSNSKNYDEYPIENSLWTELYLKKQLVFPLWSPVLVVLGRAAVELQGSVAGVEFEAQGSLLFIGGTEGGVPHGSPGLGADPGKDK